MAEVVILNVFIIGIPASLLQCPFIICCPPLETLLPSGLETFGRRAHFIYFYLILLFCFFCWFPSVYVNFSPYLSISVCFCPFPSGSVRFHQVPSVSIRFRPFPAISDRFCPFLFVSGRFWPFLTVSVRFCIFWYQCYSFHTLRYLVSPV